MLRAAQDGFVNGPVASWIVRNMLQLLCYWRLQIMQ